MAAASVRRGKLTNSGEYTTVKLEQDDYFANEPIIGTVEVSNPRNKDITSVSIELSTWRSISVPGAKQAHVEQLFSETLELFPNPTEGQHQGRSGQGRFYDQGGLQRRVRNDASNGDPTVLHGTGHYAFTFMPVTPPKPPTVDMDGGHIKHYLTCRVMKRAGMLRQDKQIEKNQFQVPVKPVVLEVDSLFPDGMFSCLSSRPNSANPGYVDFRTRCSTFLMPGLPFVVECDTAIPLEIRTITLSLHSRILVSVGSQEKELSYRSLYVHEEHSPQASTTGGHFRDRESARTLAHGRTSYLIEWNCPSLTSTSRLPFPRTLYSRTSAANIECGLALKVEATIAGGGKLATIIHGINYCPEWVDARTTDKSNPLRNERSLFPTRSPANSITEALLRRGSIASQRSILRLNGVPPPHVPQTVAELPRAVGQAAQLSSPRFNFSQFQNATPAGGVLLGAAPAQQHDFLSQQQILLQPQQQQKQQQHQQQTHADASSLHGSVHSLGARTPASLDSVPSRDDYFAALNASARSARGGTNDAGTLSPGAAGTPLQQFARSQSTRTLDIKGSPLAGGSDTSSIRLGGTGQGFAPDPAALPPASVRSTLARSLRGAIEPVQQPPTPARSNASPAMLSEQATPPPKAPLPAAPVSLVDSSPFIFGRNGSDGASPASASVADFTQSQRPTSIKSVTSSFRSMRFSKGNGSPVASASGSQQQPQQRERVILGVSQETVQTHSPLSQHTAKFHAGSTAATPFGQVNAYSPQVSSQISLTQPSSSNLQEQHRFVKNPPVPQSQQESQNSADVSPSMPQQQQQEQEQHDRDSGIATTRYGSGMSSVMTGQAHALASPGGPSVDSISQDHHPQQQQQNRHQQQFRAPPGHGTSFTDLLLASAPSDPTKAPTTALPPLPTAASTGASPAAHASAHSYSTGLSVDPRQLMRPPTSLSRSQPQDHVDIADEEGEEEQGEVLIG
ncbi:hypothetical protein PYCC9005_003840 [Savitreella phatthalungensis]